MPLNVPFLGSLSPRSAKAGYGVVFQVGEIDLSSRVESIDILNSMVSIYPIIKVNINLDSKDIPLEQIYGQNNALLSIEYSDPSMKPLQDFSMDLMIVHKDDKFGLKRDDQKPDVPTADPSSMICIPMKAIELFGTPVRKTIQFGSNKTRLDVVKEIIDETKIQVTKDIIEENVNTTKLFQWTIPQKTSVIGCIRNLDKRGGIFKGPMFVFCDIESGDPTFHLWDLSKKINQQEQYTISLLSLGKNEEDPATGNAENHFYTKKGLKVINKGTSSAMSRGMIQIISEKPRDTLFNHKIQKLAKVFKDTGIGSGENKELFFNELAKKRVNFHSRSITGDDYGKDNSYITSAISEWISQNSQLEIKLSGNLYITNLMKIGIPMILDPQIEEYLVYQGKYIVSSSFIKIYRLKSGDYTTDIEIRCFRGNTEN